jgi:5-methylcytosine-specific restriction endonuclease McrA
MMQKTMKHKTLKLDSSYKPVGIIDSLEALVLCICGKAIAVEQYHKTISSVSEIFKLPAVIVLKVYVKNRLTSVSPKKRNIFWRDANICQYCGNKFHIKELTVDHIMPKSRGGKNTWLNLTTSCMKCNQKKGARTPEEANMKLLSKPYRPSSFLLKNVGRDQISDLWSNYLWHI